MKLVKKLLIIAIIAVVTVILSFFAQANGQSVKLDLIFYSFDSIQIWLIALLSFLSGIICTILIVLLDVISIKYNEGKLVRDNRRLTEELSKIRNQKLSELEPILINEKKNNAVTDREGDTDGRF